MGDTLFLKTKDLVSPRGRIGRLAYLVNLVAFNILFFAVDFAAAYAASSIDPGVLEPFGWLLGLAAIFAVALIYVLFCIHAKRLHDLGVTAFICVVMFAPPLLSLFLSLDGTAFDLPVELFRTLDLIAKAAYGLSFVLQVVLLVTPGRHDENGYGASPKAA